MSTPLPELAEHPPCQIMLDPSLYKDNVIITLNLLGRGGFDDCGVTMPVSVRPPSTSCANQQWQGKVTRSFLEGTSTSTSSTKKPDPYPR